MVYLVLQSKGWISKYILDTIKECSPEQKIHHTIKKPQALLYQWQIVQYAVMTNDNSTDNVLNSGKPINQSVIF